MTGQHQASWSCDDDIWTVRLFFHQSNRGHTRKYKLASLLINIFAAARTSRIHTEEHLPIMLLNRDDRLGCDADLRFMIELACEVTYPMGEAMSTGGLNMGGQVISIVGSSNGRTAVFPFLANLVISVFMDLAAIVRIRRTCSGLQVVRSHCLHPSSKHLLSLRSSRSTTLKGK